MAEIGKRPSQFNRIPRYRDNTDDLNDAFQRALNRNKKRTITEERGHIESAKMVPPMPSSAGE